MQKNRKLSKVTQGVGVIETTIGDFNRDRDKLIGRTVSITGYIDRIDIHPKEITIELTETSINAPVLRDIKLHPSDNEDLFVASVRLCARDKIRLEFEVERVGGTETGLKVKKLDKV